MAVFKQLTAKELYASIPSSTTVSLLMRAGLEQGSTQLAVSAMEELLIRGDQSMIHENLLWAIKNGSLKLGTSMSALIGRSLLESHEASPFSKMVGKGLLKESSTEMKKTMDEVFNSAYGTIPRSTERTIAENLLNQYRDTETNWLSGSDQIKKAANLI